MSIDIPDICHFFTRANFLENKIYTEKRINYDNLHSKLPILRENYDKLHSKLSIFCVITAKYTENCQIFALNLKKFTPARKLYTDGVSRVSDNYEVCNDD